MLEFTVDQAKCTRCDQCVLDCPSRIIERTGDATPVILAKTFAPRTVYGTPVSWLLRYGFTNAYASAEESNPDDDHMRTWEEFVAGTDPTNEHSVLAFDDTRIADDGHAVLLSFMSVTQRLYSIHVSSNLFTAGWSEAHTNVAGSGAEITVARGPTNGTAAGSEFYQLRVIRTNSPSRGRLE